MNRFTIGFVYPAAFATEAGKDILGGQRIYNGQIDVGCAEYDWRGDFTKALAANHVTVEAAGENVTMGRHRTLSRRTAF